MTIDVRSFQKLNVADTCSLWNLLSSDTLRRAAFGVGCSFCITEYVSYECLVKGNSTLDAHRLELRRKLATAISNNQIRVHSISLEDLLEVEFLESRQRLGRGELTTIAFAKTTGQSAFSDDKKARSLAMAVLGPRGGQWTAQLLGWLCYTDYLVDHECQAVADELAAFGRSMSPHLENAYRSALHAKLMDRVAD